MKIITAPDNYMYEPEVGEVTIFLGGSIEMGAAENWQEKLINELKQLPYSAQLTLFNPRRPDWDASWSQEPSFKPFREQVEWELYMQLIADCCVYWLAKDTLSPISLFEIGLYDAENVVIGVDPGYNRRGNVIITHDYLQMESELALSWDDFILKIRKCLEDE